MIMWTFSQDINQLKRDYPQHWETFIANSLAVTCFGVMDNTTAQYVSTMLGIQTIQQQNVSTTVSTQKAPLGPISRYLRTEPPPRLRPTHRCKR